MANDKNLPASRRYSPPSLANVPRPSIPSLRYDSRAFAWSDTSKLKKDATYTRADADLFDARRDQTNAVTGLIHARIGLALKLSELSVLGELVAHHYEVGRQDRAHEIEMQRLMHDTAEANAQIELTRAKQHLASLQPAPQLNGPLAPAQHATGLTPDEVDELLSNFPDLSAETRHLVALALKGRLNEKIKGQA